MNTILNNLHKIAIFLFLFSAGYGVLLRYNFAFPLNIKYQNFLQGHSHVAFLGWGYIACIYAILKLFITKEDKYNRNYKTTIGIILFSIILMLFSFVDSGYKTFSIVLLSIFGLTSYVLSFKLLKDLKSKSIAVKFIKWGIYYYLLSSLATWFLAGVIITQGKTDLYYNTVYFYLHFLYNGFFVFVLFGLFFRILENKGILLNKKYVNQFFFFLNIACVPTYTLSILWSDVSIGWSFFGGLGATFQIVSLFFLIKILNSAFKKLVENSLVKAMIYFILGCYVLKIVIQLASAHPYFVEKSIALKPFFIIGYLHLFTLGFMSTFIFYILKEFGELEIRKSTFKLGILLFLVGVLLTELILFGNGFSLLFSIGIMPNYQATLLLFSAIILIGVFLLMVNSLSISKSNN